MEPLEYKTVSGSLGDFLFCIAF